MAAVFGLLFTAGPAVADDPPVDWADCTYGECSMRAAEQYDDLFGDGADTATPPDGDPTDPSDATNVRTGESYAGLGLDPCVFHALHEGDSPDAGQVAEQEACDPPSWEEIVAFMSSEFVSLPIAPSVITRQPPDDWALVNMDFIVFTDPAAQVFEVELLGLDVTFMATPVHYAWDFDDGSPLLETSSPGAPYPNQDVVHVYTSAQEAVTVSVTTTWQGSFQIGGAGPWYPVSSYATTVGTSGPVEIVTMDIVLVPNP